MNILDHLCAYIICRLLVRSLLFIFLFEYNGVWVPKEPIRVTFSLQTFAQYERLAGERSTPRGLVFLWVF